MLLHNVKIKPLVVFPVNVWGKKSFSLLDMLETAHYHKTQSTQELRTFHMVVGQSVPKASIPCKPQRNEYSHCPILKRLDRGQRPGPVMFYMNLPHHKASCRGFTGFIKDFN